MSECSAENGAVEWTDPPALKPSRAAVAEAQLRASPGRWARLDSGPLALFPSWWSRFYQNPEFEVRFVRHHPGNVFGPRDVYVRAIPPGTQS